MNSMPIPLHEQLRAEIIGHARDAFPNEACGFITVRDGRTRVVPCKNTSGDATTMFRIEPEEYEAIEDAGDAISLVWHSHPDCSPEPSDADKAQSENMQMPFLIVSYPQCEWRHYIPSGWEAPLLGRPFVHGIFDCWALLRDYHKQELGITLPDFDRPDDWWVHGGNLILENTEAAGFRRINSLVKHAGILMFVGPTTYPNHVGVYLGDGLMMHHLAGRLSKVEPYLVDRGAYSRNTYGLYLHESQCSQ